MTSVDDTERDVSRRAERFKRVRDAHQTEMAEDYVELIADLIDEKGEARVVDWPDVSASPSRRSTAPSSVCSATGS